MGSTGLEVSTGWYASGVVTGSRGCRTQRLKSLPQTKGALVWLYSGHRSLGAVAITRTAFFFERGEGVVSPALKDERSFDLKDDALFLHEGWQQVR